MVEYTRPTGTTLDFSTDSDNSYTRQTGTTLDFDITTAIELSVSDSLAFSETKFYLLQDLLAGNLSLSDAENYKLLDDLLDDLNLSETQSYTLLDTLSEILDFSELQSYKILYTVAELLDLSEYKKYKLIYIISEGLDTSDELVFTILEYIEDELSTEDAIDIITSLWGVITLDDEGVEDAFVMAYNMSDEEFLGTDITNVDGEYKILSAGRFGDIIFVAAQFEDSSGDKYGRLESVELGES